MNQEMDLTRRIIGAAIEVHRELGPGLLESAYHACLVHEMIGRGIYVECQKPLPISFKGRELDCGYRIDLMVENQVLVEIKSIYDFNPIHEAQILTYMKLSKCKIGLLINFNTKILKQGIRRFKL